MLKQLEHLTAAPDTPYGQLLHQAQSDAEAAIVTLSAGLQDARDKLAGRQPARATPDFLKSAMALSESLIEPAQEAYQIAHNDPNAGPVLQSRAAMYAVLSKYMTILPALFRFDANDRLAESARSKVVDKDAYRVMGEFAINGLRSIGADASPDHQQALGEITTVALGFRGQNRSRLVLPALHKEVRAGTNLDCFNYVRSMQTGGHTPVQYSIEWPVYQPDVVSLSAEDIGCAPKADPWRASYPFGTIHAIELELENFQGSTLGPYNTEVHTGLAELQSSIFRTATEKIVAYQ
jgi:hypothetical protein